MNKISIKFVNVISILIPIVVALILGIRTKIDLGSWTKALPHFIGLINATTAVSILVGVYFIKNKKKELHQAAMTLSMVFGLLFLICYVTYHISNPSTSFGGTDQWVRVFYYFNLIGHILLSLAVLPFVLRAYYFAQTQQFQKHRSIAKWAYPLWLYVSISGVVAYLMIRPYYV